MTAFVKSAAAAAAALAAAATLIPAAASAQSYGYGNGYNQNQGYSQPYGYDQGRNQSYDNGYRDRCQTLGQGRTGAGALIGGGLGAVAGSQIAARGNRTEGSIIGGVLGAIVGAQVGRSSNDQCRSNSSYTQAPTYYSSNDRYSDRAYASNRYDDRGYRDDDRSNDRRDDRRYENGYEVSPDGHYYFRSAPRLAAALIDRDRGVDIFQPPCRSTS